jgi:HSP20 family protein
MTNTQVTERLESAAQAERKTFLPAVNIYETQDRIVLMADMPGVDEKSVDITLENDVLTVHGRGADQAPEGYALAYAEYLPGDYRRSFTLAEGQINRDGIEAVMKNGVLKVILPKAESQKTKRIAVRVE